ncbi:MAG: phosphotransferase family protein [Acidimicrobiales bacterium]
MERSSADVRDGLERWARQTRPDAVVAPLVRPNDGLSSETYLVDISGEMVVARVVPTNGVFPHYDLSLQARLQEDLAPLGVPTAPPIALVDDPAWIGRPFLLMRRVAGHVLSDNPPFSRTGWLHDAGPDLQRTVFTGFMDVLADIHRVDCREVAYAARRGGTGLRAELAWWGDYLAWATGDEPIAELAAALDWCATHVPEPEPPPSLLWGDVRLGNVIFDDAGQPAAVLDWEMASIGPAEVDLGWFFALRDLMAPPGGVELPGFLDRDAALARYQDRLGRPVGDLWWYELFALVRSTSVLVRTQRSLIEQGHADHWLVGFDPVPPRLREFVRAQ